MRIRVFGHYLHGSIGALVALESMLLFCVFILATVLRLGGEGVHQHVAVYWPQAFLFTAALVICLLAFGLYSSRQRARTTGIVVRVAAAVTAGITIVTLFFFFIPNVWVGRGVLLIAAGLALVLLAVLRMVFYVVFDESLFKRRVLVYGTGRNAAPIGKLRRRADRRGFALVGFVQPEGEACEIPPELLLRENGSLPELCDRYDVDEIVVAMDERRRGFPIRDMLECRLGGTDITELLTFLERETGRVRIDVLNPSWLIFGQGFRRDTARLVSSRLLDLAASTMILLLTLPVMIVTAIAIKIEDGLKAPVFYAQPRVGLGGRVFNVLKFRSMRTDAERHGAQWATKGDTRVTRVGSFIRKCRIDELPQILCVFRGHMSFVGPRPERPQFVAELSEKIPYYVQRHSVKPGITGWAQLCYPYGSSEQDALEKLQYDLYYIKNNTLLFDLAILLQTAEVVFMGKGAR
jgi:sugar transferase (PEP-CTERM system associated)